MQIAGNRISVTDLSSQIWCEQQLKYKIETGLRIQTAATIRGHKRHEELELQDHELKEISVQTREDNLGVRMLNTIIGIRDILFVTGHAREVWIAVPISGDLVIRGVIDDLSITETKRCLLKDTKTRATRTEPSDGQKRISALQLATYYILIDRLQKLNHDNPLWDSFFHIFKCNRYKSFENEIFKSYTNLDSILVDYISYLCKLPPMENYAFVEYDCDRDIFSIDKIPINMQNYMHTIDYLLDWWYGERETLLLSDSDLFKCRFCEFLDKCNKTPLGKTELCKILNERAIRENIEDLF